MIFTHMANYFRNENFKISKVQKKVINRNEKILDTRILIMKLKGTFSCQSLMNKLLYCRYFLFLKLQNSRFENN